MKHVVFDIGNVLLRWRPEAAFPELTPGATRALFERVDFPAWNRANDAGRSRAEAYRSLARRDAALAQVMDGYFDRFAETIAEQIPESWAIARRLARRGHRLFALTNFSADLWPVALRRHPELGTLFEDVVVSGIEGVVKPDPRIYARLCARNHLPAAACLLIDDQPGNVAAARALGWQALTFTDPTRLDADLRARALL